MNQIQQKDGHCSMPGTYLMWMDDNQLRNNVRWDTWGTASNIAYNIVNGLCTPISDKSAPVYITIGDGGN
ncbi:hypothetical protein MLD38_024791 [Melastoma candidum]|uniref:Uncharacterized protein n=1 Tax=Melastoma candidum TaxID=119954 RepID=A0ACB9NUZ6_9MYRT|nr:hypothetical protein MLD38_024791 [Melastoma candidum]